MTPAKKPIDKKQTLYHLFKVSTILYRLYDDLMDVPVEYGSLNVIMPAVHSILERVPNSYIIFYDKDSKMAFKRNDVKTNTTNKNKRP